MVIRGVCPGSWKCCVTLRGMAVPGINEPVAEINSVQQDALTPIDQTDETILRGASNLEEKSEFAANGNGVFDDGSS